MRSRGIVVAIVPIVALGLSATTWGNFKELSQRLPAPTNAVIAINVAKLLSTPYAKTEWAANTPQQLVQEPTMTPPGATRILMAAEVAPGTMESTWECSLMEMENMPTTAALAAAEGGHVDRLWDKDAVCSPINAYFVPLESNVLASITPANRAAIVKWVRTPAKPEGNVTSEYIQKVLVTLGDQTDIVMALDLEGAFGVPRIRKWLDDNDVKGIKDNQLDEIARTLGTMKGITLTISVDKDASGRAAVDFDKDVAPITESAKALMLEILNSAGMRIDDIQQWTFSGKGKQVIMEGKLSTPALRKLMSIVQSPIPAATVAKNSAVAAAPDQGSAPTSPAEASQRYYKVICANLDNFRAGTSPAESANWARATAKRIDQLPILNVDPQLVQWGAMVSTKLKQAGGGLIVGQTQMNARVAGVADPAYSSYAYDNEGNYATQQNRGDLENARRQRRQAALEQKAASQEQALRLINEITETRPAIRAAMVEKYKIEF